MTHDPLCPNQNGPDPKCYFCHLIDMARRDEQGGRDELVGLTAFRSFRAGLDAAREAVAALHKSDLKFFVASMQNAYDTAVNEALAAIDALREGEK